MPLNSTVGPFPLSVNGVDHPHGNLSTINKPSLTKISAVDIQDEEAKKLSRGISRTAENALVISQIRNELSASLAEVEESTSVASSVSNIGQQQQIASLETNDCTFTLPDLSNQSDEFRAFLENELIDTSMNISLQESCRLNWWTCLGEGCERLWPLSTTGDGNCLLHAASLGMWGFHDRLLILRKALHALLTTGTFRHALWRRWRWQNARSNLQAGLDLFLNEDEWKREWDNILKLASSQPRTSGSSTPASDTTALVTIDTVDGSAPSGSCGDATAASSSSTTSSRTYESLEEIHVLALAHVLKRPIFVIADTVLKDVNGEALAPITFGGIYLPLEIEPSECSRSPLVLAYDAAHFSALVAMTKKKTTASSPIIAETDPESPAVIPLVDVDRDLLPIQFEVDPGEGCVWNRDELNESVVQRIALTHEDRLALLNQFLDLVNIPCPAVITKSTSVNNRNLPKVKNDAKANGRSPQEEGWSSDGEFNGRNGLKAPGSKLAKQFGSLGRSVGRKIKKNLMENFNVSSNKQQHQLAPSSRLNNQWECPDFILCARLHTEKHHPCLEQMINNYMMSARARFEQQQSERQRQTLVWQRRKQHTLAETALQEGPSPCINPNCTMFGTAVTSYMCTACYARQLEQEEERVKSLKIASGKSLAFGGGNQNALYGAGKSVFYTSSDSQSYAEAAKIPATKPPGTGQQNGTLYLSNSTFYGETPIMKEEKVVFEKINPLCYERAAAAAAAAAASVAPSSPVLADVGQKQEVPALITTSSTPSVISVDTGRKWETNKFPVQPEEPGPPPVAPVRHQKPAVKPKPVLVAKDTSSNGTPAAVSAAVSAAIAAAVPSGPSPRLLSHYDTIRKPCKSSGCTSYGMAGTNWFCAECYHIRKKAALARESILEGMKAAQMQ